MNKTVAKLSENQPPRIVALGTAPAMGWGLCILLDAVFHVDAMMIMWIIFPSMLPILMLADLISRKLKPSRVWIVGTGGWIASFAAIWIYLLLKIK